MIFRKAHLCYVFVLPTLIVFNCLIVATDGSLFSNSRKRDNPSSSDNNDKDAWTFTKSRERGGKGSLKRSDDKPSDRIGIIKFHRKVASTVQTFVQKIVHGGVSIVRLSKRSYKRISDPLLLWTIELLQSIQDHLIDKVHNNHDLVPSSPTTVTTSDPPAVQSMSSSIYDSVSNYFVSNTDANGNSTNTTKSNSKSNVDMSVTLRTANSKKIITDNDFAETKTREHKEEVSKEEVIASQPQQQQLVKDVNDTDKVSTLTTDTHRKSASILPTKSSSKASLLNNVNKVKTKPKSSTKSSSNGLDSTSELLKQHKEDDENAVITETSYLGSLLPPMMASIAFMTAGTMTYIWNGGLMEAATSLVDYFWGVSENHDNISDASATSTVDRSASIAVPVTPDKF